MQVCGNGCTLCLFTQHWMNYHRVSAEGCSESNKHNTRNMGTLPHTVYMNYHRVLTEECSESNKHNTRNMGTLPYIVYMNYHRVLAEECSESNKQHTKHGHPTLYSLYQVVATLSRNMRKNNQMTKFFEKWSFGSIHVKDTRSKMKERTWKTQILFLMPWKIITKK